MELIEKKSPHLLITNYLEGSLRIGNKIFKQALLITNTDYTYWSIQSLDQLTSYDWMEIIDLQPELVLLGTGEKQQFPDAKAYAPLVNAQIGCEVMDSAAAARTFNVLVTDKRQVVAAILI